MGTKELSQRAEALIFGVTRETLGSVVENVHRLLAQAKSAGDMVAVEEIRAGIESLAMFELAVEAVKAAEKNIIYPDELPYNANWIRHVPKEEGS